MDLVPVIDLMGGIVVHARQGDRSRYRPLHSTLCQGSAAKDVVGALLKLHPFRHLYLADLDAIQGQGNHAAAVAELSRSFPDVSLWVDAGVATAAAAARILTAGAGIVVVGTETLRTADELTALRAEVPAARIALSLDYRGDQFLGPPGLDQAVDLWPDRVIVMTLARVGSGAGPDLDRIGRIVTLGPRARVYAAGGVRSAADLAAAAQAGAAGVLLASALHDGSIGGATLARHDAHP